jgi:hypothetical protein
VQDIKIKPQPARTPPDVIEKKVRVLKVPKHSQIGKDADDQKKLAPSLIFNPAKADANKVVNKRGKQNQKPTKNAPTHIEHVAGDDQEPLFDGKITQALSYQQHNREKEYIQRM